jgi:hypothetical protein
MAKAMRRPLWLISRFAALAWRLWTSLFPLAATNSCDGTVVSGVMHAWESSVRNPHAAIFAAL